MGTWPHITAIQWNDGLDAELRALLTGRRPSWADVAKRMGFCVPTCQRRAKALGIAAHQSKPGRPSAFNAAVDADILARRAAGQSFAAIGVVVGVNRSSVWARHRELTRSAASAAHEVGHGTDAAARVAAFLDVSSPNLAPRSSRAGASLSQEPM